MNTIYSMFHQFDEDESGTVTRDELKAVFEKMIGKKVTNAFADERLAEVDFDKSGEVEFDEYVHFMTNERVEGATELLLGFEQFDREGGVTFPKDMLVAFIEPHFDDSTARSLLGQVQVGKDGKVDL